MVWWGGGSPRTTSIAYSAKVCNSKTLGFRLITYKKVKKNRYLVSRLKLSISSLQRTRKVPHYYEMLDLMSVWAIATDVVPWLTQCGMGIRLKLACDGLMPRCAAKMLGFVRQTKSSFLTEHLWFDVLHMWMPNGKAIFHIKLSPYIFDCTVIVKSHISMAFYF